MPSAIQFPPAHLILLFFFFIEYFVAIIHWWFFVNFEQALFGEDIVDVHLAFNIIGSVIFIFFASPFLFMPYYYRDQMEYKIRRNSTVFAVGLSWLFHDLPLWFIEFWIVWNFGWIHLIQGLSLILISLAFAVGFFSVWLGYAWKMSKFLQTQFSGSAFSVGVVGGGGPMQGDSSAFGGNNMQPRTI